MPPVMSQNLPQGIYVHAGCGPIAPEGWLNLDASWNVLAARVWGLHPALKSLGLINASSAAKPYPSNIHYCDVTKGLPLKDGKAAVVYSSHMLEHLTRSQAHAFLSEAHRVLTPGGIIRLVVPDLEILARRYLEDKQAHTNGDAAMPANQFMTMLNTSVDTDSRNLILRAYHAVNNVHSHKWMYDAESLRQLFAQAGFVQAAQKGYLDSEIDRIAEVERRERFVHGIAIEARR